jgi:peptide/nickel transport system substrate-binding protein
MLLCVLGVLFALVLSPGCGGASSKSSSAGSPSPSWGGEVRITIESPISLDPVLAGPDPEDLITRQIYEGLTEINSKLEAVPRLASRWQNSTDDRTWTFYLRKGVQFSNGVPFTAKDVLYTFKRLMDPKLGGTTVDVYSDVASITAPDDYTVVFHLKYANPELPKDIGDYHSGIVSSTDTDPAKQTLGTGPFFLKAYSRENRMVLERNPHYWMKDPATGRALPYLDRLVLVFSPDPQAHVEALRGGSADWVINIPSAMANDFKNDPKFTLISGVSNNHYLLHIRSDKGHPGSDVRVIKAIKLGTDLPSIVASVRQGYADVGNTTEVGPIYGDYYLNKPPVYDPAQAKKLLAEAGYPNGFTLKLYVEQYSCIPQIATVWQQQMKKIGVNVQIQEEPEDVYYGSNTPNTWLVCDWGITDWATRPRPVAYFNISLVTGSAWNESHWSDPEFDKVTAEINRELDQSKRAELYKQAQQIIIDRGPVMVFFDERLIIGMSSSLRGFQTSIPEVATSFRSVYWAKTP